MKKFLISFVLMLGMVPCQLAQNSSDEQQLKELVQQSFDTIFSEKNINLLSKYYTEDFLLLEQGEIWDLAKIEKMMKMTQNNPAERINEFEFIEIKVAGDMAWLAYHNKAIFERQGQKEAEIEWLESATAKRTPGGWKLDMLHSTRKPDIDK